MPEEIIFKTYEANTKAVEGERAFNVTITTTIKDRDGDIVEAKGAKLANYRKNPVVLMAHDYRGLAIARAEKIDKEEDRIKAKIVFPPEGDYPLADIVYRLYKGNFMRGWSIGFIPIKSEDILDEDAKDNTKVNRRGRRIKLWELLEFSACAIPSNPEALTNMISKGIDIEPLKEAGFIEIEDEKGEDMLNEKIEETEEYIRIPAKGEEGKHKGHKIRWITVSDKEGIKGIYCIDCKKIITFVFDKKKGWTLEKAKKWMEEHGKNYEDMAKNIIELLIYEEGVEIETEEKSVIPFKETPKAPEDEEWDAAREVRQAEVSDLKVMCAWYDSENPDIKTSYKLPHHKVKGHAVVWRAVAAAMAALLGARGGVNIPESDKKGVYNHLVKHYKQFDKMPPEFRDYDPSIYNTDFEDTVKAFSDLNENEMVEKLNKKIKDLELKAGAVLNAKNKQNLKNAQALIQEVLDSAEPVEEDSLEVENEKVVKNDDIVIDVENSEGDDKEIDKESDEDIIEVDEEIISKAIDERMGYILGKVKNNPIQKNKIERK